MYGYDTPDNINYAYAPPPDNQISKGTMGGVIAGAVVIVIGTALGLGLGIGLHSDDKSLIFVTTTTIATTTTITDTTTTTTTALQSTYSSSLSSASAVYGGINQSSLNYTYEAIQIVPSTSGTYNFTSTSSSSLRFDGFLYNNSFSVTNPLTNLIATDFGNTGALQFNLLSTLQAGVEYILVVSSENQTNTGSFTVTATGPGTVTFTRRTTFSQIVTYGTLSNNGTDDASNGTVTINTNDVISGIDGTSITGYVTEVSLSFFSAPTAGAGQIYIYVLNGSVSTLVFTPTAFYLIPTSSIAATTGVQTFSIPRNQLSVVTGQYVGVGIGTSSGSLNQVPNLPKAFLVTTNFASLTTATYNSKTPAAAFLFRVFTAGLVVG